MEQQYSNQSVFNKFMHPDLVKDQFNHAKAKLMLIFVLVMEVICIAIFVWQTIEFQLHLIIALVITFFLVLSIPILIRTLPSLKLPGAIFSLIMFILISFAAISGEGIFDYSLVWYSTVFLFAFIVVGAKGGLVFGLLSIGMVLYLFFNFQVDPALFENPVQRFNAVILIGLNFASLISLMFVYNRMNTRFQSELKSTVERIGRDERSKSEILSNTSNIMDQLARGNLTERINADFGDFQLLKDRTNHALEMLGETLTNVKEASDHVAVGANELRTGSQNLANGTTQQAASLEQISSTMSEIASKAKINNDNASQARDLSTKSTQGVENGNNQVKRMVQSMEQISQTSTEVTKVIKAIDEIAFQTNLLSLNAAVEAARAGKYGKGFAVVAEEVRALATRSADAAKNTTSLIENSIKEVERGVDNANKTAEVLNEIEEQTNKVNDFIAEIAVSSQEQVSNVEEINESLNHVNNIVQQNSSISEETASATEELSRYASKLQYMVEQFKITGSSPNTAPPSSQPGLIHQAIESGADIKSLPKEPSQEQKPEKKQKIITL